jgi:hypothetical protein
LFRPGAPLARTGARCVMRLPDSSRNRIGCFPVGAMDNRLVMQLEDVMGSTARVNLARPDTIIWCRITSRWTIAGDWSVSRTSLSDAAQERLRQMAAYAALPPERRRRAVKPISARPAPISMPVAGSGMLVPGPPGTLSPVTSRVIVPKFQAPSGDTTESLKSSKNSSRRRPSAPTVRSRPSSIRSAELA